MDAVVQVRSGARRKEDTHEDATELAEEREADTASAATPR